MGLDATPLLRLYALYRLRRLKRLDPVRNQEALLLDLVRHAAGTRFGRDHGFSDIRSVADFQAQVPIGRYEAFWRDYWEAAFPDLTDLTWPGTIRYFAETSGTTTGKTKYIPVSQEMIAQFRRATLDLLAFHVANRPKSRILGGKSFMLGGSTAMREWGPGVFSGDLSGISALHVPSWAKPFYFPPKDLAVIGDWERKIREVGPRSLAEDIRLIGGTTSWLLLFLDGLADHRPGGSGRIVDYYPNLEMLVHGGVAFEPYRAQLERLLEGSKAELREVYPASEGFIAVGDRGPDDGLRLIVDGGLFYEFVPLDELETPAPTRRWLADVEVGVNYAVLLSTCSGMWSYVLGDTVRFVDLDPPRIVVTGRTSYQLSAFGEHLIGEEIEHAVAEAATEIEAHVVDFSVGAVYPSGPREVGGHLYVVEFLEGVPSDERVARFAERIDAGLSDANVDYRDHRAAGFGMHPPQVVAVPPGSFSEWMRRRGKLGGQNKVPRVINDRELFRSLRDFAAEVVAS